jgi:hypothetical protein
MGKAMEFYNSDALQPPLPREKTSTSSATITKPRAQTFFFEASSSTTQENIEMHDKEKGPSVDIACIVVQLKSAGGGSAIGSGCNALNITVNK